MKQKLLTFIFSLFFIYASKAQVIANYVDDFENGTTQSWIHAAPNANSPVNISTGGPGGVNDNYLSTSNNGVNFTNGARHIFFNNSTTWIGGFTSEGIVAIRMDIRNSGALPLHLRVAFRGGVGPSWMSTSTAVVIASGGGWSTIEIPILASDFVITQDVGDTKSSILNNVSQMRILSNDGSEPDLHKGDLRVQLSDYDNIKASTTLLSTKKQKPQSTFLINPNPGSNKLNLKLSRLDDDTSIEIFDVLGKKVHAERLNSTSRSIDVFKWNSGVYLVRITSDNGTQTKRFVKQ